MKPREFWIGNNSSGYLSATTVAPRLPTQWVHVREVIEVSESDIEVAGDDVIADGYEPAAFIAGARWAITKLTGADNE